jgi:hypothetical protein
MNERTNERRRIGNQSVLNKYIKIASTYRSLQIPADERVFWQEGNSPQKSHGLNRPSSY